MKAIWTLAPLAVAVLAACDDPAKGLPPTAPGASDTASASSGASASASASAAAPAAAEAPLADGAAPGTATVIPAAPVTPSTAAPATAPGDKADRSSRTGILPAGAADRLLPKGQPSRVRLLDGGAEPRTVVRYALDPGKATHIEMGLTMTLELSQGARAVPAQKIPRIATLLDLTTASKPSAEGIGVDALVRGVSIAADSGLPQQVADKLLPHLRSIEGLELHYEVTPHGRVRQAGPGVTSGKGAAADTTLAQMTQSLESMIAPFPEEPIGLGARWEVIARFDSSGTELVQWSTFELRERDEETARLGLDVMQAAAHADVHPPNLPPGVAANLTAFHSTGTGESLVELARPAPKTARMQVDSEMTLEVDKGDKSEAQRTTMKSSMLVDMGRAQAGAPKPKAPPPAAPAPASPPQVP